MLKHTDIQSLQTGSTYHQNTIQTPKFQTSMSKAASTYKLYAYISLHSWDKQKLKLSAEIQITIVQNPVLLTACSFQRRHCEKLISWMFCWIPITSRKHVTRIVGPIPETIHSRSAQIRSCDPDRPIAFHKHQSQKKIGSWDRESMKPNILLPIESWQIIH